MTIEDLLIRHEGLRLKPYKDSVGKLTIGVGRNIDDIGITKDEALFLLRNDVERCRALAIKNFEWFQGMFLNQQNVVISMIFNLGLSGFCEFKEMIKALERGDYDSASKEMLDSKWAKQVGQRAIELSELLTKGPDSAA